MSRSLWDIHRRATSWTALAQALKILACSALHPGPRLACDADKVINTGGCTADANEHKYHPDKKGNKTCNQCR
jgi:hypothetical protein